MSDLEDLLRQRLKEAESIVKKNIKEKMADCIDVVFSHATERCPRDEEKLLSSIHTRVETQGSDIVGLCGTNQDHAIYVHEGTGKYNPEHAKRLKWYIPEDESNIKGISRRVAEKYHFKKVYGKDGKIFYETEGQRAQPFLTDALHESEPIIKEMLKGITGD